MPSQPDNANSTHQNGIRGRFRWGACVLGLVFPGLGHISIGERGRGYRIMAGFLMLWIGGLLIGGLGSVRQSDTEAASGGPTRGRNLWFYAQLGAGPIAVLSSYLHESFVINAPDEMMIPVSQRDNRVALVNKNTAIGHAAEFGTLYCALAGLMNVAVALDAGRRTTSERRERQASSGGVRIRRATSEEHSSTQEAEAG